ncbi:hypothetical protein SCAR479_12248 [Seiridium cardinale]|uniref:Uncharacterized protein n=1 Tax=Seiridium cardinale TaxID=138064 RepID=A0ABR2XBG8_9PEZI
MSSDANYGSDSHRRHSREPQQSTSGAPSLPPLRSLTNSSRRSAALTVSGLSHSGGRYGRWRAERYPERHRPGTSSQPHRSASQAPDNALQMMLSEHGQQNRRMRLGQTEADAQQLSDLDDANNQLRALLDFTPPPPPPPAHAYSELSFPSPPLQTHDSTDDNRRAKRRKLDSDHLTSGFKGFRYGRYGQVESGPLTMEIVSCDGGIYSDVGHSYAAENILKNDPSVYCTKGPRCNIVLRHQGSTVFTLKELVIKAPRQNYTAPVREGMVFISMNLDHLLTRTAQYRIPYMPSRSSSRRGEREARPLAPIVSIRHNEDGTTMTTAQIRARRLYNIGMDDEENDYRSAQIPSEFTASPPPFHVTTVCSDDEDDSIIRPYWRAPNRIGSLPFESDESSGDELGLYHDYLPPRSRLRSPLQGSAEDAATSQESLRGSHSVGEGDLMAAHAKFFIEPDKSKCTIRFDPPVSGRFILLKMWSPRPDSTSNIDIQAVIANGFAGPRYFPAVDLR